MKKDVVNFVCILFCLSNCFIGCKTSDEILAKKTEEDDETFEITKNADSLTEEKIIIPLFDDWEYKGFGAELPETVEKIIKFDNNFIENGNESNQYVKNDSDRIIVSGFGVNADQAKMNAQENLNFILKNKVSETLDVDFSFENFELVEDTWVRLNPEYFLNDLGEVPELIKEKPYIAYKIYYKK